VTFVLYPAQPRAAGRPRKASGRRRWKPRVPSSASSSPWSPSRSPSPARSRESPDSQLRENQVRCALTVLSLAQAVLADSDHRRGAAGLQHPRPGARLRRFLCALAVVVAERWALRSDGVWERSVGGGDAPADAQSGAVEAHVRDRCLDGPHPAQDAQQARRPTVRPPRHSRHSPTGSPGFTDMRLFTCARSIWSCVGPMVFPADSTKRCVHSVGLSARGDCIALTAVGRELQEQAEPRRRRRVAAAVAQAAAHAERRPPEQRRAQGGAEGGAGTEEAPQPAAALHAHRGAAALGAADRRRARAPAAAAAAGAQRQPDLPEGARAANGARSTPNFAQPVRCADLTCAALAGGAGHLPAAVLLRPGQPAARVAGRGGGVPVEGPPPLQAAPRVRRHRGRAQGLVHLVRAHFCVLTL